MLVALLSTLEQAGDGASCPRGFLHVGGRTVIERQAALALGLGCERIICVAEGLPPELIALQHQVEHAGARFHAVSGREALHVLVSATDEVLVIADGMLPEKSALQTLIGNRKGVLAIPAAEGLPAGYERIDRDWCWAGVARCAGADVERIADLPRDIDPLGALMRSALQAGRPVIPVPDGVLTNGQWWLVANASSASAAGRSILSQGFRPARWSAPGNALIDRIVLRHADDLLRKVAHRAGLWATAGLGLAGAIAAAYLGTLPWSLFAVLIATIALRALAVLQQVGSDTVAPSARLKQIIPDLALLAVFLIFGPMLPGDGPIYPLLVLLGGMHLCERMVWQDVRDFGTERPALLMLLLLTSSIGETSFALQLLSLAVLAVIFVVLSRDRITPA